MNDIPKYYFSNADDSTSFETGGSCKLRCRCLKSLVVEGMKVEGSIMVIRASCCGSKPYVRVKVKTLMTRKRLTCYRSKP